MSTKRVDIIQLAKDIIKMEKNSKEESKNGQKNNEITILIIVPVQTNPLEVTFSKTAKIVEVVAAVVEKFGFAANGQYEIKLESDPNIELEPQKPLVSYGIKDGDKLVFIDFGQAV